MKKTFSLSAARAALLIALINSGYSFGSRIDDQIKAFGAIAQPSEATYPLVIENDQEMTNLLTVLDLTASDDELTERYEEINELSLFFVNSEIQDATEKVEEAATEIPQVTLTSEEMTVICLLHLEHGLTGILADEVADVMTKFKEGIPADADEFVIEEIEEVNAVDIITAIYEAEKNAAFSEYLPVLDNLKDKFAQFCKVVPEPREE